MYISFLPVGLLLMYVLTGFVVFSCLEASCSVSYAGVNLGRLQRNGNLSIYIRISGSSSAQLAEPPSLCSCAAHMAQHHNAQGPSVHTGGGGRGGGCYILEKHHIIYPTSKFSHYFYPRKTQPAPSALFPAPVPAAVLCSAKLHVAATAQGQRGWAGEGQGTQPEKPLEPLLPLDTMNQGGLEVPFHRWGVLMWQSPAARA